MEGQPLPKLVEGESLPLTETELHQGKTSAPDYLTESELISLMEKHGIGTDASIPVHINNICERNYVTVQAGRRVVPTELGITLVKGYQLIDPELCRPQVQEKPLFGFVTLHTFRACPNYATHLLKRGSAASPQTMPARVHKVFQLVVHPLSPLQLGFASCCIV